MSNITLSADRLDYLTHRQSISNSCVGFISHLDTLLRKRPDLSDAEHAVISDLMQSLRDARDVFDIF